MPASPIRRCLLLLAFVLAAPCFGASKFTLQGQVTAEPGGEPVARAMLWLWQEAGILKAKADKQGHYQFSVQQSGAYQLVALAEGHALGGVTGFIAGDATMDFSLPPAQSVTVEVIGPTSQPLANARLSWLNVNGQFNVPVAALNGEDFPQYRSGADGKLTLPPLPEGGFVRLRLTHFDHADLVVDYLPVREKQPALQMMTGQRISGRVVSPDKAGIADARVTVFQVGVSGQREFASASSDPEGFFHCRVPVGDYSLAVRHPQWASPAPQRVQVKGEEDTEAIVTMAPPRLIAGKIELPDGKPAAGTYVAFLKDNTLYEETFTDAGGGFHLRVASPQGMLRLVPPHGYVTEQIADIPVAMEEAKEVTLKTITLRAIPRLTGIVLDSEGKPVANAILTTPKLPDPSRFASAADGSFDFLPDYLPEERVVYFHAEHPQRFERADFIVDFSASQRVEVKLSPYEPAAPKPEPEPVAPPSPDSEDSEDEALGPHKPMLGKEAPALSIAQWFNTEAQSLASLKGKAVVLCFWGSFDDSPQGIDALEELSLLHSVYAGDDAVAFIAVHDATSTAEEVQAFLDGTGITFPVALDTQRFETFTAYKVTYIPEFVLIDKQGKIRYRQPGDKMMENLKVLRRE